MVTAKWCTLCLLSLAELLAMSVWFSATAVIPALTDEWGLSAGDAAWLTMAVQIGFVVGALISAALNLPDIFEARKVVAVGAWCAAATTAAVPVFADGFAVTVVLRGLTGMVAAVVYPVGMKIMASWTREDRGLGLGMLVGALTLGSGAPHLVRALGEVSAWRPVIFTVAGLAVIGGVIVWVAGAMGPYGARSPRFEWRYMGRSFRVRALRLANFGYLGHMWELYAMWTWIPAFLIVVYQNAGPNVGPDAGRLSAFVTFGVLAVGGIGSLAAGRLADTWGRTRTTIVSMLVSGACAAVIGLTMDHPWLATSCALIWGFAIVADSAQFSTSINELGEPEYMGTLLTTQTAVGFLLTLASIRIISLAVDLLTWRWAFATLAIGPALGSWAMWLLKRSPEARHLAGGKG